MTSMISLLERDADPRLCLPDSQFSLLEDLLRKTDAAVPGLDGFRESLGSHRQGRWFAMQRGRQTVFAGAVASTPAAAGGLWQVLDRLRHHRLPESEPVGRQHPGRKNWAELSFQDFTGVSRHEASAGGIFATRLLRALMQGQPGKVKQEGDLAGRQFLIVNLNVIQQSAKKTRCR